jgi:hypothetical protein
MDRNWMYTEDRMTQSFHDHVNEFLDVVERDMLQKAARRYVVRAILVKI